MQKRSETVVNKVIDTKSSTNEVEPLAHFDQNGQVNTRTNVVLYTQNSKNQSVADIVDQVGSPAKIVGSNGKVA